MALGRFCVFSDTFKIHYAFWHYFVGKSSSCCSDKMSPTEEQSDMANHYYVYSEIFTIIILPLFLIIYYVAPWICRWL